MLLELRSWVEWTKSVNKRLDAPCPVNCADLKNVVVSSSGQLIWVLQWLMSILTTKELGALWLIHAKQFITYSLMAEIGI